MGIIQGLLFWGYVDDEGKLFAKRYISDKQIENYEMLPFVKGIFDPFYAYDINHAREIIEHRYRQEAL